MSPERPEPNRLRQLIERVPPMYRDVLAASFIIALIMGGLWGYTGQPFPSQAPLVVVESGSMMHFDQPYGRLATIDPGDLILVKDIDGPDDVVTLYGALSTGDERGSGDREGYGHPGDVVIYHKRGDVLETPIIHRAITWVEVTPGCGGQCYAYHEASGRWVTQQNAVRLPEISLDEDRSFRVSGWITKGDNPTTNREADQANSISSGQLIEPDWIIGKARGEIAWIGLLKFIVQGNSVVVDRDPDGTPWCRVVNAKSPCDTFVMLWVTLAVLILVPVLIEGVVMLRRRQLEAQEELRALSRTPPPPEQLAPWDEDRQRRQR